MTQLTIDHQRLSQEALNNLIEAFILQEGTDYGSIEWSMEQKVAMVMKQLEDKQAKIVFDADSESCWIVAHP